MGGDQEEAWRKTWRNTCRPDSTFGEPVVAGCRVAARRRHAVARRPVIEKAISVIAAQLVCVDAHVVTQLLPGAQVSDGDKLGELLPPARLCGFGRQQPRCHWTWP
jgi:hypothetical protein